MNGESTENNARPAKRPRLAQGLPDAFAPTVTSKHAVTAPRMHIDFDRTRSSNTTRPLRPLARPDFSGLASTSAIKLDDLKRPLLARPRPPLSGVSKPKHMGEASSMKVSALRPVLSQPTTSAPDTKIQARESNTSSMLHRPPVIHPHKANTSLKPVPGPPPLPRPTKRSHSPLSSSKLKTISTTRVAIATDLSADVGSSGSPLLFLNQRTSPYLDPVDRELGRGLDQSPEKRKDGGGKGKFIRGGLAESLSRRFAQSNTDQKLWEEYTARTFTEGKKRMKADLKLKTVILLHRSPLPQNALHKPRSPVVTLAKCLVLDTHTGEFRKGSAITVLFRHATIGKNVDIQLREGIEVHVWRPWLELSDDVTGSGELPKMSSPVWLCSRFHVVESAGVV